MTVLHTQSHNSWQSVRNTCRTGRLILKEGDKTSEFKVRDDHGNVQRLNDYAGKSPCTGRSAEYRENDVSIILGKDGFIKKIFPKVKVERHVDQVLQALE